MSNKIVYHLFYLMPTYKMGGRGFKTLSEAQNCMKGLLKKGYHFATIEVCEGQKYTYIDTLGDEDNE